MKVENPESIRARYREALFGGSAGFAGSGVESAPEVLAFEDLEELPVTEVAVDEIPGLVVPQQPQRFVRLVDGEQTLAEQIPVGEDGSINIEDLRSWLAPKEADSAEAAAEQPDAAAEEIAAAEPATEAKEAEEALTIAEVETAEAATEAPAEEPAELEAEAAEATAEAPAEEPEEAEAPEADTEAELAAEADDDWEFPTSAPSPESLPEDLIPAEEAEDAVAETAADEASKPEKTPQQKKRERVVLFVILFIVLISATVGTLVATGVIDLSGYASAVHDLFGNLFGG
ncbi:MAG: hypothetical protein LBR14_02825 [Clostridiales Family XIII bacterium]|jgi:hypothetical protein|nr:hypothetical protein [Clostridiales Family XIII bacterium]